MMRSMAWKHLMSLNPAKRLNERWVLLYTAVWGAVAGLVMVTGLADDWGDAPLMIFGVGLWLGVLLGGLIVTGPDPTQTRAVRRYHLKFQAWMFLFAFLGNYFGTRYFYEVLHMHYGFATRWNVNDAPLFLYFTTVPYFSTYAVLLNMGRRGTSAWARESPPWVRHTLTIPVALTVAALETALNANPFIASLFCYDDLSFTLWFGTLMYGTWFAIALPFWFPIDEAPGRETPWTHVLVGALAAFMLILCSLEVFAHVLGPLVTSVEHGAVGLQDFGSSCLEARQVP